MSHALKVLSTICRLFVTTCRPIRFGAKEFKILSLLCLTLIGMGACTSVPIPQMDPGRYILSLKEAKLRPGMTQSEVVNSIGQPDYMLRIECNHDLAHPPVCLDWGFLSGASALDLYFVPHPVQGRTLDSWNLTTSAIVGS